MMGKKPPEQVPVSAVPYRCAQVTALTLFSFSRRFTASGLNQKVTLLERGYDNVAMSDTTQARGLIPCLLTPGHKSCYIAAYMVTVMQLLWVNLQGTERWLVDTATKMGNAVHV